MLNAVLKVVGGKQDGKLIPLGTKKFLIGREQDKAFHFSLRDQHAIERIPEIDSDQARQLIETALLKESSDYIATCVEVLQTARPELTCQSRVTRGHFLKQYTGLIEDSEIDLLVANTKDDDQLAMHGMAYSLSVELINTAMLLL